MKCVPDQGVFDIANIVFPIEYHRPNEKHATCHNERKVCSILLFDDMKLLVAILLVLICFVEGAQPPKDPARRWWITVEVGSPLSTCFEVNIFPTGVFEIKRKRSKDKAFKPLNEGTLAPEELAMLIEAARKQISEFKYPEREYERSDGTNVTLKLSSEFTDASVGYRSIRSYKEGGEAVRLIVDTINAKIPKASRIW